MILNRELKTKNRNELFAFSLFISAFVFKKEINHIKNTQSEHDEKNFN